MSTRYLSRFIPTLFVGAFFAGRKLSSFPDMVNEGIASGVLSAVVISVGFSEEIHDGFIRYVGTRTLADGSEAEGSFDLSIGEEKDMLKACIVAVDIPGVDLDDPRIVKANIAHSPHFGVETRAVV